MSWNEPTMEEAGEMVREFLLQAAKEGALLKWLVNQRDEIAKYKMELEAARDANTKRIDGLGKKLKHIQKEYYNTKKKNDLQVKKNNYKAGLLLMAKDIINHPNLGLPDHVKSSFDFLNRPAEELGLVEMDTELNNTDNLMSELSYTLNENTLMEDSGLNVTQSQGLKRVAERCPSENSHQVSQPKNYKPNQVTKYTGNKDDELIVSTTVTVQSNGPVTATSVIEALPSTSSPSGEPVGTSTTTPTESGSEGEIEAAFDLQPSVSQTDTTPHAWRQKAHIFGESCIVCSKKIKFSRVALKCGVCAGIVHTECKDVCLLPCVPKYGLSRINSTVSGCIADFAPHTSPMIPPIVVNCITEIESRGLKDIGLYRVPGSEREVKLLKDKLLKEKGFVDLSYVADIRTICGCLKEFFISLRETLIPPNKRNLLAHVTRRFKGKKKNDELLKIIKSLDQPNRDTLFFLVSHLKRVAAAPDCKMPIANLSKMFGLTIVGFAKCKPDDTLNEADISNQIMADILMMPSKLYKDLLLGSSQSSLSS